MKDSALRKAGRRLWELAGPQRSAFLFAFTINLVVIFTDYMRPMLQLQAIDHVSHSRREALIHTAWLFFALILFDYIIRSIFSFVFNRAALRTIQRLRMRVFRHVLSMKMAFFDKQPVGVLLTRTINDSDALGESLRSGAATLLMDVITVVVTFVVFFNINHELSLYLLLAGPPLILAVRWCGTKLKEQYLEVRKHLATSNGVMAEGIMGVEILQLFGQRQASAEQFRKVNREYRQATIINNVWDALLYALIDGIAALTTATILFFAFNLRFGLVDLATAIVFLSQIERIFNPIRQLSAKFAVVQQAIAALDRIYNLLELDARIPQGERTLEGEHMELVFKDVNFRYQADGPLVLADINFSVKPGQTLALVGQTGSGKSTIARLLTRAYDGYSGRIEVNGHELGELNYHSLRSKIAVVHQDVELFAGSLRDNIAMFDSRIGDEAILEAVRLVHATHLIEHLPGGLDFQVVEGGGNLSSGQKQLIVFARALAHDAPVVLMDEATSSVDSVTEAWIQEAIAQIMRHKTVIVVAHRLSTIAAANHILVLKGGRIIEQGKHGALLAIEGGYYAGLVEASKLKTGEAAALLV